MVKQPTAGVPVGGLNPGRLTAVDDSQLARNRTADLQVCGRLHYHWTAASSDSTCSPHCLNPSEHKLLNPPPPHPSPSKSDIKFQGIEASESKNPLGDCLIGQKKILQGVGDQISCLGVCYANDPQKGGGIQHTTPAPALDLTTSLQGAFCSKVCFAGNAFFCWKNFCCAIFLLEKL